MFLPAMLLNGLCTDFSFLFGQNKLNKHVMDLTNIQCFGMVLHLYLAFVSLVNLLGKDLH